MQLLTLEQAADFHELVTIEQTINIGPTLVHICNVGTADDPCLYVFVNDADGNSVVSPDFFAPNYLN